MSKLSSRRWPKAVAVDYVRLYHSPSTRKDSTHLPHETNSTFIPDLDDQLPARPLSGR